MSWKFHGSKQEKEKNELPSLSDSKSADWRVKILNRKGNKFLAPVVQGVDSNGYPMDKSVS